MKHCNGINGLSYEKEKRSDLIHAVERNDDNEWKDVLEQSAERGQVVFKHSTTCPVSANALNEFKQYLAGNPNRDVDYLLIKVIEARPVSNQIAEDLLVKHESPQIIYVKNKEKYWTASHWAITSEHMSAVLD